VRGRRGGWSSGEEERGRRKIRGWSGGGEEEREEEERGVEWRGEGGLLTTLQ
jgi:hypothetical protein